MSQEDPAGIGAATALKLAEAGANVSINARHEDAAARDVRCAIEKLGRLSHLVTADLGDPAAALCCFTRNKDGRTLDAVSLEWLGKPFRTKLAKMEPPAEIALLGAQGKLAWHRERDSVVVESPESLEQIRPCEYAWVFRIRNGENLGAPVAVCRC